MDKAFNMTLGERIRTFREAKGLHPNDLAELVGSHVVTVYKWERDGSTPKLDDAAKLADVLGVTIDQLAGRMPWTPPPADVIAATEALRQVREARGLMAQAEDQLQRALGGNVPPVSAADVCPSQAIARTVATQLEQLLERTPLVEVATEERLRQALGLLHQVAQAKAG